MEQNRADIVYTVIKERRSVRSYQEQSPSKALLERLLQVGQWAPSPSNVQSWRFVVVEDAGQLSALKTLSPGFPKQATAAIVVCSHECDVQQFPGTTRDVLVAEEAAMAVQNMSLMAHALGLGSCAVASFSAVGITALLELPDYIRPILILALGIPDRPAVVPQRKELSQITHWNTYQEEPDEQR